ncbi:MAG: T9SS type A sorting domain-containing protein [Candidatus Cloacimonetes bacterium]|nr:T9SS type A sorting domain-containing protein [Candidatus Cloacimonadota bacterium]
MGKFYFLGMILMMMVSLVADGVPPEGSGTEDDPYLVAILDNLLWISTNEAVWDSTYYFLQTADIDASDTQNWNDGAGFDPIGYFSIQTYEHPFQGYYNGDHFIIDGLFINRPIDNYVGLFGFTIGAVIRNLGLTNVDISGGCYVGGLAGSIYANSLITDAYVTGIVTGEESVGGLAGRNLTTLPITNCYAAASVEGEIEVGGLTGENIIHVVNSYYNYETSLINGQHLISMGALTDDMFTAWMENEMSLDINDYLTEEDGCYLINDLDDFRCLLAFGQNPEYDYRLNTDLDLIDDPGFFIPCLRGDFLGYGHLVNNLYINTPFISNIGLFGFAYEAAIAELGITNAEIHGFRYMGCLAGFFSHSCLTGASASGNVNGVMIVGGLVGGCFYSEIIQSWANADVVGESSTGGLSGRNSYSYITESYAAGNVAGNMLIGGLSGGNTNSQIADTYATGSVSGEYITGGLVGQCGSVGSEIDPTMIVSSYATGSVTGNDQTGGFIGCAYGYVFEIASCIWNVETSGQSVGIGLDDGGTVTDLLGLTTAEMLIMSTYTDIGWDFAGESVNGEEDIWGMEDDINDGFPFICDLEYPVSNEETIIDIGELIIENYPNPFNPETTICFSVPEGSDNTEISIYNLKGQKVVTLVDEYLESGKHSVVWQADGMASGVYLVWFQAGGYFGGKKVILLK